MADDDNTTVSFRLLPPALHEELLRRAEAAGTTKHQLARTLVARALSSGEPASGSDLFGIEDAFQAIQLNLVDLRMALGRGIGAILQQVATDMDKEQIRTWVFERIISATKPANQGDPNAEH